MSSLDTLKQELVKQKKILEQKGFTVNTQYQNPAPSEITTTISSIDENMAKLSNLATTMITGVGNQEVYIPADESYTKIRDYAYYSTDSDTYYHNNFIIPSNINTIGKYAFADCSRLNCDNFVIPQTLTNINDYAFLGCSGLKGDFVLPWGCYVGVHAFQNCTGFTKLDVHADVSSAQYAFQGCTSIKKITFHPTVTFITSYFCADCSGVEEVFLPSSVTSVGPYSFRNLTGLKYIFFESDTAPSAYNTSFRGLPSTARLLVPYTKIKQYIGTSNYSQYFQSFVGYGTFQEGEVLPDTIPNYQLTWHATFEDARDVVNPITICPTTGMVYCSQYADASIT